MQDGGRAVSPGSARAGVNVTGGGSSTPELWGSGAYAQAQGLASSYSGTALWLGSPGKSPDVGTRGRGQVQGARRCMP